VRYITLSLDRNHSLLSFDKGSKICLFPFPAIPGGVGRLLLGTWGWASFLFSDARGEVRVYTIGVSLVLERYRGAGLYLSIDPERLRTPGDAWRVRQQHQTGRGPELMAVKSPRGGGMGGKATEGEQERKGVLRSRWRLTRRLRGKVSGWGVSRVSVL